LREFRVPLVPSVATALAALLLAACGRSSDDGGHPLDPPPAGPLAIEPTSRTAGRVRDLAEDRRTPGSTTRTVSWQCPRRTPSCSSCRAAAASSAGRGIPALIEIVNSTREHIRLVDAGRDLARRTHFFVVRNGQRIACGAALASAAAGAHEKDVDLAPGETYATEVDLLRMIEDTRGYLDGKVRFRARFQGQDIGAKGGPRGWNTDADHQIESREVVLDITVPKWLADLGGTDVLYQDMRNTALMFQAGAPDEETVRAGVARRGNAAYACLLCNHPRDGRPRRAGSRHGPPRTCPVALLRRGPPSPHSRADRRPPNPRCR